MIFRKTWILTGIALNIAVGSLSALAVPVPAWDGVNSPTRMEQGFSANFNQLPLSREVTRDRMPWSDTYWPANRGGIAYRWNSKDPSFAWQDPRVKMPQVFNIHSPTREEAFRMTREQLMQLSPTEKYDLVLGHYDYPMTHQVLRKTNAFRAYWEGICHGWAPASVNHSEPMPVDVTSGDRGASGTEKLTIPFGSADVKAILDYYYATVNPHVRQMGKRCNIDLTRFPNSTDADCADVNAGAFHIVLTNYIGLRNEPFVADVSRGNEVWNNPIYNYDAKVIASSGPASNSASGTLRRVLVETTVRYSSDDERLPPQWNASVDKDQVEVPDSDVTVDVATFENVYRYEKAVYKYWLELDANNQIIGGDWVSAERPDYIWMKQPMAFTGDFAGLKYIYKPMYRR
jgi:hypothetical protein